MSYWERVRPVRRARAVDIGKVARASVRLLDEGGLGALTVRAVAAQIAVAPASLYSRVESVEDLFDLALDAALGEDAEVQRALDADVRDSRVRGVGAQESGVFEDLMLALYRHLVRHRWAPQILVRRAPRGPHYLRFSERMCVLLEKDGAVDPLGSAYTASNFVIGSAATAPMLSDERAAPIDADVAPLYERLHAGHRADPEALVVQGLASLRRRASAGPIGDEGESGWSRVAR